MTFKCLYCSQTFATPYVLKQHISVNHQYIAEDEEQDVEILIEKDRESKKGDETDEEIDNNLTFPLSIDPEDFYNNTSIRTYSEQFEKGFDNLCASFEEFLTENNITYNDKSGYFKIYSSVAIKLTDIIQTARNFYSNEWFSNVVISSEEDDWYRKALLLLEFFTEKDKDPINLILLQWYDDIDEMYGCPRL
ncbi:hypothetical protein C1645_826125 [Glomus cerebriforme]|uniref:C2H2-type domain-containing protein n=1 Tax=Glomus cerebriforme TaxID=658196 RepID=A0A397SX78_9GLOM|nr:hypothetical protein C1645_826125 [Glomus cerebriforme]